MVAYSGDLEDRVIEALRPAVGRALSAVDYCVMNVEGSLEMLEEDISRPDFCTGGAIKLTFDGRYSIWANWQEGAGWLDITLSISTESLFYEEWLVNYDAGDLDLWRPLVGSPLVRFDVLSRVGSDGPAKLITPSGTFTISQSGPPHAVRLVFETGSALVGNGIGGLDEFGDGDDVFARPDTAAYNEALALIWSSDEAMLSAATKRGLRWRDRLKQLLRR
jgi:hypothetical protein